MNVTKTPADPTPQRRGRWSKFKFAFQAIEVRLRFIAILVLIGLLFGYWDTLRNYWDKWTRPANAAVALAGGTEFYCPMHPQVVRDTTDPDGSVPECPICGMPLSKRNKGEQPALPAGRRRSSHNLAATRGHGWNRDGAGELSAARSRDSYRRICHL